MFENAKCEYCGELFAKNDDIVVCPDCGAPYHRNCWQEHGMCAHEAEHAAQYRYAAKAEEAPAPGDTEEDFVEKIKQQIIHQPAEKECHCENCGALLIEGDDYCVYCGHKQGDPISASKKKHIGKDPLGGMRPEEEIGGEKVGELALLVRSNAAVLLPRMQKLSQRKLKLGWSWPAFIFGYLYLFFRKLYKYGIIMILAQVMLFNVLNVAMGDPIAQTNKAVSTIYSQYSSTISGSDFSSEEYERFLQQANAQMVDNGLLAKDYALVGISLLVSNLACALLFDYLYLRHCKDTISRMRRSADILGGMSRSDYRLNLLARGGISIFGVVLGYMARFIIEQAVEYIIEFFAQLR